MEIFSAGILLFSIAVILGLFTKIGTIGAIGILMPFEVTSIINISGISVNVLDFYLLSLMFITLVSKLVSKKPWALISRRLAIVFLIALHGIIVTVFAPTLFQGQVMVADVAGTQIGQRVGRGFGLTIAPLMPSKSNLSQLGYLLLHLSFFMFLVSAGRKHGPRIFMKVFLIATIVNFFLVMADILGLDALIKWFFTSDYRDLQNATIHGIERAVGGFREGARQAQFSAAMFGLWLAYGINTGRNGAYLLALFCLLFTVLTLSSTMVVCVAASILYILAYVITNAHKIHNSRLVIRSLILFFTSMVSILLFALMISSLSGGLADEMVTSLIFDKSSSGSGLERFALLKIGIDVASQTYFLGAGLGSTRANGFVMLWLSNLGIIGLYLYCRFIWTAYFPKKIAGHIKTIYFFPACTALSALLAAALASLTVPNLGLIFYICLAFTVSAGDYSTKSTGLKLQ